MIKHDLKIQSIKCLYCGHELNNNYELVPIKSSMYIEIYKVIYTCSCGSLNEFNIIPNNGYFSYHLLVDISGEWISNYFSNKTIVKKYGSFEGFVPFLKIEKLKNFK